MERREDFETGHTPEGREGAAADAPARSVTQAIAEIARDWLRTERTAERRRREG